MMPADPAAANGPEAPVNFATVRPQVGPIAAGPGTLRGAYAAAKANPQVQQAAQAVQDAHPQDEFARGPRVAAANVAAGYRLGKSWAGDTAGSQPAPAGDSGGWSSNGDGGGDDLATKSDVEDAASGLHDRLGNIESGMASSGMPSPQQNMGALTPARMPDRPASVSPLAQSAAARKAANAQAAGAQQNLQAGQQRTMATFQARQQATSAVGVKPAGSAIGMSNAYAQQSFYGQQGSQNGVSAANWESSRWSR